MSSKLARNDSRNKSGFIKGEERGLDMLGEGLDIEGSGILIVVGTDTGGFGILILAAGIGRGKSWP